ncbi:MAG TPA: hypothetical protein VMS01_16155 [Stellaceae bacterium]|nr:hypothetical protein [Stellaceae bacterium]
MEIGLDYLAIRTFKLMQRADIAVDGADREAAGAQEPHVRPATCGQIHHQPARFDQRQNRSTQAEGGAAESDIARFLNITVRELLRLRFPV